MNIHYLQHVPFEDLGNIENWAVGKGHALSVTRLYKGEPCPGMEDFDWLIVMGGPMNIYEEERYPWLADEKRFIREAIEKKKRVLGVCLGAQLIADLLGGKVYGNGFKEIGWFPVTLTDDGKSSLLFGTLPGKFTAFHWHGDTFHIPAGAKRVAESEGCVNQAFEYDGHVVGLQFHLETSPDGMERLIDNCRNELMKGRYIQSEVSMKSNEEAFDESRRIMTQLLDAMEKSFDTR